MEKILGDKFGEFQQFVSEFWLKPPAHTATGGLVGKGYS